MKTAFTTLFTFLGALVFILFILFTIRATIQYFIEARRLRNLTKGKTVYIDNVVPAQNRIKATIIEWRGKKALVKMDNAEYEIELEKLSV